MLTEDAPQLRSECIRVRRGQRFLRVPRVREVAANLLSEKIRPQIVAIIPAERRRLSKEPPPVLVENAVVEPAARKWTHADEGAVFSDEQARVDPLPHA